MSLIRRSSKILTGGIKRFNLFIENNPYMKLGAYSFHFFGLAVLIGTGIQIVLQLQDRERELEVREAAHRHVLRESLFSPIPGSSGKGAALQELLLIENATFSGLDLSCERMRGGWNKSELECTNPVQLYDLDFKTVYDEMIKNARDLELAAGVEEFGIGMDRVNFSGVQAFSVRLSFISASQANFSGAELNYSSVNNATISGDFRNLKCEFCDLSNSELTGDFTGANFKNSNISGIWINGDPTNASWGSAWAWADALPLVQLNDKSAQDQSEGSTFTIDKKIQRKFLSKIKICLPEKRNKENVTSLASTLELEKSLGLGFESECEKVDAFYALSNYENNSSILEAYPEVKSDNDS